MHNSRPIRLRFNGGNQTVFRILLLSAVCVTLIKLFSPLIIHWDLSIQLETADRFVRGLGLTNAFSSQFDLNQPPTSEYLTHFPPGLALLVSAFLFLNIPLAVALKTIYASATMIGWLGWSIIGARCLSGPMKIASRSVPIHLMIAAILPLLYTPSWTNQGTDIFLWAGVPIVLLCLLPPYRYRLRIISTVLAGLIVGLLLSFRYASAFLLLAALLLIFYQESPKARAILARYTTFFIALSIFLVPLILYIQGVPVNALEQGTNIDTVISSNNLLETHSSGGSGSDLVKSLDLIFSGFSRLYYLTGIHAGIASKKISSAITSNPMVNSLTGLIFLSIFVYICSTVINYSPKKNLDRNTLISLVGILISFTLFSVALTPVVSYNPLIIGRYYVPVQICIIFILYSLVMQRDLSRAFQKFSRIFIYSFLLFNLVLKPAGFLHLYQSKAFLALVFPWDATPTLSNIKYPSNEVLSLYPETSDFLAQIEKQESNALFFIQQYPLYISYLKFEDPEKFRRIPDNSFWEDAYLSQATKLFFIVKTGMCSKICASPGNFNSDNATVSLPSLASLPNLETVFTSNSEKTSIMVSELPAGYKFGE